MNEHQQEQDQIEKQQTVEEFLRENAPDHQVITVTVDGGMVAWVDVPQGCEVRVLVKDYDTGCSDEEDRVVDDQGQVCNVTLWSDKAVTQRKDPCEACGDRGWILAFNTDRRVTEIQRCDACDRFASDEAAAEMAVPLLEAGLKRGEQSHEDPHGNTDKE